MRKILFLMCMFLCAISNVRADETTLSITSKLSNSTGDASATIGNITFSFTGTSTTYQNAYVKMMPGSALTVSTSSGTITKIVLGYADGRTNTLSFTANTGTWKSPTWTGGASSVTLTGDGNKGECSVSTVTVTYSSKSSLTFANSQATGTLTDLGMQAQKPTSASGSVTYSSSNTKIAQVDNNGWIRFVNTGMTTITAKDSKGNSGSYSLIVSAEEATATTSGNTYTLAGSGKISNKYIQDVPYIQMRVGTDREIAMAKTYGTSNYFVITCLDANGYVHAYVDKTTGVPTMGTYYVFNPSAKGKLTVKGVFYQNGTGTADAKIFEGSTTKGTIAYKADFAEATGAFDLEAGKTYYLYVPTTDKDYDVFCLNSFTYESQYYFKNKSVRVKSGTKNYTQKVTGGDGSTYSVKAYGGLSSASVNTSGNVTWNGDGGALVVTAKKDGSSDSYVITVPYSTHEWDFRNTNVKKNVNLEDLKDNTTDWAVTYKVRQFDQTSKALTYLNPSLTL